MQLADTPSPQTTTLGLHPVAVAIVAVATKLLVTVATASRLATCSRLLAVDQDWCESNPQPFGYESDTLPLHHCTQHCHSFFTTWKNNHSSCIFKKAGYCQRNSGYRPSRVNIMARGLSTPDPSLSPTHLYKETSRNNYTLHTPSG